MPENEEFVDIPSGMETNCLSGTVGQRRKRIHRRTTQAKSYVFSSFESEKEPAKDLSHEGQFTAEALAQKEGETVKEGS